MNYFLFLSFSSTKWGWECYLFILLFENEIKYWLQCIIMLYNFLHISWMNAIIIYEYNYSIHTQSFSSVLLSCNPIDYSPTDSSAHRISQTRVLEWVAISFSRGSSQSRDGALFFFMFCIGNRFFAISTNWEAKYKFYLCVIKLWCISINAT